MKLPEALKDQTCSAFTKQIRLECLEFDDLWEMEMMFDIDDVERAYRHLADYRRRFPTRNYRLIALAFEDISNHDFP